MNNDLISRSALKKVINEYIDEYSDLDNEGNHCEKWCAMKEAEMAIDDAPPIETTIEDVMSMLSEDSLEATEWFKVDTPSGKEVIFEKRNTGWWLPEECGLYWYRRFSCSKCENEIVCRNVPNYCQKCGAKMKGIYNEQKTTDASI